ALAAKTYGDADFDGGASSTNNSIAITYSSSNPAVATIVDGKIHIVGAGTADMTASQAAAETYTPADAVTQTLTGNKAALTVTANGGQQKVYGQADPVFTYTVDGYQNSDDETVLQGALSRDLGENVSKYKLLQGTLNAGNNYSLVFQENYFAVTPATLT